MIRAGELRERVTLRRKVQQANAYGTLVETDSDYATVWAKVAPKSGRERDRGQQTETAADYTVGIRYLSTVLVGDYVVWRGREMRVAFIRDAGPREPFLELDVKIGPP